MVIIIFFILLGIGLFLPKDKSVFYIYMMYLLYVFKFIITFFHISAPPASNYAVLLLLGFSSVPYLKKYITYIVTYTIFFFLYFFLKSIISGLPFFSTLVTNIGPLIISLGAIALYENTTKGKVCINKIRNHIFIILGIQAAVCWVQYLVPAVGTGMFIESYEWGGKTADIHNMEYLGSTGVLVSGLMISSVNEALLLSLMAVILVLSESVSKSRITINQVIILIFAIPTIVMTGIRAPLFILMAMLLLMVFKYERKYFILSVVGIIAFYFVLNRVMAGDDTSGFARIEEGMKSLLVSGSGGLGDSTFGLSLFLIPFFIQNPLFGVSLGEYKTSFGFSIGGDGFSSTDAQLLYTLCEIGIIGLVIYLYPYIKYLKIMKVDKKENGIKILFIAVLLLSIVDLGIFLLDLAYLFVVGCVILANSTVENKRNTII